jgi:xanthine dehydrogenase YagR molybdenum-binding subunit
MQKYIGTATSRLDGRAKVAGEAKYAAEYAAPDLAHCNVVTSRIAKGRIKLRDRRDHARE